MNFPILAQAPEAGLLAGGLVSLLLWLFALVLAIAWLIFPFIVISKCNEMIKVLTRIDERPEYSPKPLEALVEESQAQRETLERIASSLNETNVALQWFVDNWPTK